jgi:ubiquinone/menaquinone biosynthesis C-methylase UbiE
VALKKSSTAGLAFLLALLLLTGCTGLKRWAYEGFNREEWQKPEEVISVLDIKTGDHVADVGSGSGYFTFRLANAVGPSGKVFAVDVDRGMNDYLRERARAGGRMNIDVILAEPDDPRLPPASVDMIFAVNTYHFLENRTAYFARADKYLRPGGRVVIIDFNRRQWFDLFGSHYTSPDVIKSEMRGAGFELKQEFTFLPKQAFLVFSRSGG